MFAMESCSEWTLDDIECDWTDRRLKSSTYIDFDALQSVHLWWQRYYLYHVYMFTCVLFRSWVAHQFFACKNDKNVGICRSYWPSPGWTAHHAKCPSTARGIMNGMYAKMTNATRISRRSARHLAFERSFLWHAGQASLAFDWSCNSKPKALKTATGTGLKKRLDNSSGKLCCPYIAQAGHSCIAAGLLTWCHFFPRRCNHRLCWSWSYYKQLTRLTKREYDLWLYVWDPPFLVVLGCFRLALADSGWLHRTCRQ